MGMLGVALQWTSVLSREGGRNSPRDVLLWKPGDKQQLDGSLGPEHSLYLPTCSYPRAARNSTLLFCVGLTLVKESDNPAIILIGNKIKT